MDHIEGLLKLAQTALRTIGIGDLSNSQTPSQDEARARQEALDAEKEKYLLPSQSTPARNPRGFFQESYAQQTSEVLENQGDKIARTQSSEGAVPAPKNPSGSNTVRTQSSAGAKTTPREKSSVAGPAVTDRSVRAQSTNTTTPRAEAPPAGRSKSRGRTESSASSGSNIVSPRSTSKGGVNDDRRRSKSRGRAQSSASFETNIVSPPNLTSREESSDARSALTDRSGRASSTNITSRGTGAGTVIKVRRTRPEIEKEEDDAHENQVLVNAHKRANEINKTATDGAVVTKIGGVIISSGK